MTAIETPTLTTERLRLRPFRDDDTEDIWRLQSDAEVLRYWDSPPWKDRANATRFVERCRTMADEGRGVRLAIERDGRFIGWLTVTSWNEDFRSAQLGYVLAQDVWGQGYATEAARAAVAWAFVTLDLNRVQAEADTRNMASRRVLEKLGFQLEGTLREDCIVDGVASDSWVLGLLRREWQATQGS